MGIRESSIAKIRSLGYEPNSNMVEELPLVASSIISQKEAINRLLCLFPVVACSYTHTNTSRGVDLYTYNVRNSIMIQLVTVFVVKKHNR